MLLPENSFKVSSVRVRDTQNAPFVNVRKLRCKENISCNFKTPQGQGACTGYKVLKSIVQSDSFIMPGRLPTNLRMMPEQRLNNSPVILFVSSEANLHKKRECFTRVHNSRFIVVPCFNTVIFISLGPHTSASVK